MSSSMGAPAVRMSCAECNSIYFSEPREGALGGHSFTRSMDAVVAGGVNLFFDATSGAYSRQLSFLGGSARDVKVEEGTVLYGHNNEMCPLVHRSFLPAPQPSLGGSAELLGQARGRHTPPEQHAGHGVPPRLDLDRADDEGRSPLRARGGPPAGGQEPAAGGNWCSSSCWQTAALVAAIALLVVGGLAYGGIIGGVPFEASVAMMAVGGAGVLGLGAYNYCPTPCGTEQ